MRSNSQPASDFTLTAHNWNCFDFSNCNCFKLTRTNSIKYLGVEIDQNLNWKQHINNLKTRIRKLIPVFKKIRNLRDASTNKCVYFTLCQSLITYGISAWGGARQSTLIKVERAQRCILKVVNFKCFRYSTSRLYNDFKVLTVRQLFIKGIVLKQHSYNTTHSTSVRRTYEVYRIPTCKSSFAQGFSYFLAPFLYNRISKIRSLKEMTSFGCKKAIDEFLGGLNYEQTENILKILK